MVEHMKWTINTLEIVIGFMLGKVLLYRIEALRCPKVYGYIHRGICVSKKNKTCRDRKNEECIKPLICFY